MKQSSLLLQILALCLLFLFTETTANEATLAATREARLAATIAADAAARGAAPGVIELTTLKLDENIRDGSIWFIEFYAPWCHHCTAFAPSYARIAVKMHALQLSETTDSATTTKRPIKVAKINADQERACSSRFNVKGFPSFYLVDGWTAYQYEGKRNEEQIIAYIRGGYKSEDVSVLLRLCCSSTSGLDLLVMTEAHCVYRLRTVSAILNFVSFARVDPVYCNSLLPTICSLSLSPFPSGRAPWARWVNCNSWYFTLVVPSLAVTPTWSRTRVIHPPWQPLSSPLVALPYVS
jgi:thiol-disulfide isomerase/thioredoxin